MVVDDPGSDSIHSFEARLTTGTLGAEWKQGRDIRSIQAVERFTERHPWTLGSTVVAAIGVVVFVLVGFGVPLPHSWSFTISKSDGAFESFPSGSQVSGQWSSPEPVYVQIVIVSTGDLVCPVGGASSGPTSCSYTWSNTGTFGFTSVGGQVQFIAITNSTENISLTGTWSAVMW